MRDRMKPIDTLFFAYHGLVGVLVGIIVILSVYIAFPENETAKEVSTAIGSTFIVGSLFGLLYTNLSRKFYYDELRYLIQREESGFRRVFPRTTDPELIAEIVSNIGVAKDIRMYGIALNILWDPEIVDRLKQAASDRRTRVTILLADVNSPQVQQRLTEE